jgi:putative hydrolase of the HAD superfamily
MGFGSCFDGIFASAFLGVKKPDQAFYERDAEELGCDGPELLFWDDSPVNVAAARACQWHAEHYTSLADVTERLPAYVGMFAPRDEADT